MYAYLVNAYAPKKKKASKTTRSERAAMVIDRWAAMELKLTEANAQLARSQEHTALVAQELLRVGEELRETVHSNTDLAQRNVQQAQQLAAAKKELDGADREMAGVAGMVDFLWDEIDRYRNRCIDFIRWDAMLPDDLREAVRKVRVQASEYEHAGDEKP